MLNCRASVASLRHHAVGVALLVCVVGVLYAVTGALAVTIRDYTVTAVTSAEVNDLPSDHWARYTSRCSSADITSSWSDMTALSVEFPALSPSLMRVPFYAWNSTPWYVTNMGFLSPTPYGMCDGYCVRDFFATVQGNYAFSENVSAYGDGGGDWPMISLYLAPFDTAHADPTQSFLLTQEHFEIVAVNTSGNGTGTAPVLTDTLVEYCRVPLQGTTLSSSGGLTAQVAVYVNGTIVMRYHSLPAADALPSVARSTGLIYSKTLRKVVATPTAANGVVAYRFDPVYDVCDGVGTAAACAATGRGADCVWCASTSACASRAFVSEVCPRGQWEVAAADAGSVAQKFYNVTVDFNGEFGLFPDEASFTTYLGGYSNFFLSNTMSYRLFGRAFTTVFCYPGLSCWSNTPYRPCNSINSTCPNGNYSRSVLALESALGWSAESYVRYRPLLPRTIGAELCTEKKCEGGSVLLVNGSITRSTSGVHSVFAAQLYIDANGVVDLVVKNNLVKSGAPFLAYPPIRVGLVRYGVGDPSSVLVPQSLLRSGVHVRFVPQTSCGDCGLHGRCDEATGRCGCVAGHYGVDCRACPACWGGSRCDDGVNGSGACVCDGGACAATCGGADGDVAERSCVGCSAVGGRCDCGACVCVGGWSGALCDVPPADGCRAYSLDGCAVCGQHTGCAFCFDSVCFNTSLSGTASGYVCSYSTPATDTRACRTYGDLFPLPSGARDGSVAVFVVIVVILVIEAVVTAGVCAFCCRSRRVVNPATSMVGNSTVGLHDDRRGRMIMQVCFIRETFKDRALLAVPLKQTSLARLFKRRKDALQQQQQQQQ
jgi:hypothetical protein